MARLLVDMGPDTFHMYSIMRLLADENDIVSVQQADLAALLKCTRQTVHNRLRKLVDYRIQGIPVVRVEEFGGAGYWNTFRVMWDLKGAMTINGINLSEAVEAVKPTTLADDKLFQPARDDEADGVLRTARDVILYWNQQYEAVYGRKYEIMNWGKEMGFAKRLLTKYGSARGKLIIRSIIQNYDVVWKSPRFPTPTLGQAVSWLGKQAEAYADKDETPGNAENDDTELDKLIEEGLI